jgi:hypothetical protein
VRAGFRAGHKEGGGRFLPEFETQLAGAKAGDEREVRLTFPEDYHAKHLAGQEARFEVVVKEVKEKRLPAIDDELAKSVSSNDKRAVAEPRAEPNRAPAPATRPTPTAKKKSSGGPYGDAAPAPAPAEPAPAPPAEAKSSAGRGKGSGAAETLVQRADRLFTEGRWADAAAAYRELLRNDPRNSEADRWRRRLAVAAQAEGDAAARRAAPAAADRQR